MTETIVKKQLKLSIPMAFENLVTTLMSLIDVIIIANLGMTYLTAIGAISVIINIINMIPQSINVSNIAIITKKENQIEQKKYLSRSLTLCMYLAVTAIIIVLAVSPAIPYIFNIDKVGNIYLYIRLAGFLQSSYANILFGYLRTNGKQATVLIIQIVSVVLNLVFDIIAVKFGGGIIGVALVTIAIDTLVMIVCFILAKARFSFKIVHNETKEVFNLFKWNFTERIVSKVDYFVFNIMVAKIGQIEYSVHTVLLQISETSQSFIQGFSDGFAISISKITDNEEELKIFAKVFKKIFIVCSIIFSIIIFGVAIAVIYLSFSDIRLITLSWQLLPFLIIAAGIITFASFYFSYLRGIREFKFLTIRNLISSILKIGLAIGLSYTVLGVFGVWSAYIIYNISQYILSKLRYDKINLQGNATQ